MFNALEMRNWKLRKMTLNGLIDRLLSRTRSDKRIATSTPLTEFTRLKHLREDIPTFIAGLIYTGDTPQAQKNLQDLDD